jgi:hypothetical protein
MKQILPNSTFSLWNFLRLWLSSTYSDLLESKREKVFTKNWRSILWFRFLQYLGTYQGYHYSGRIDSHLHQGFYYPPGVLSEKTPAPRPIEPIKYEN